MKPILLVVSRLLNRIKKRIQRVLDKIVKGLYFNEFSKTIESGCFVIDDNEFLHKQARWRVEEPNSISIGEEFKYFKRILNGDMEYNLFFYNIHYFRLLYRKKSMFYKLKI